MSDPQRYQTRLSETRSGRRPLETLMNILGLGIALAMGVGGYMAAEWFLLENEVNHWVYLPPEFAWPPAMPFLGLKLVVGVIALALGGALFTLLYGLIQPVKGGRYDVEARESNLRGYRR